MACPRICRKPGAWMTRHRLASIARGEATRRLSSRHGHGDSANARSRGRRCANHRSGGADARADGGRQTVAGGKHERDRPRVGPHLSALRSREGGDDAHRHVPVVLRMRGLPRLAEAGAGGLLRVLQLRERALPARADARAGRMLRRVIGPPVADRLRAVESGRAGPNSGGDLRSSTTGRRWRARDARPVAQDAADVAGAPEAGAAPVNPWPSRSDRRCRPSAHRHRH